MYDVKHTKGKFVTTSQKNPLFLSPHQPFHMKKAQRHQGIVRNPYMKYDFKSPGANLSPHLRKIPCFCHHMAL